MRLVRTTLFSVAVIAILIGGFVRLSLYFAPHDFDAPNAGLVLLAVIAVVSLLCMWPPIARSILVIRCRFEPEYRKALIKDLDSPWCAVRCRALQLLVDYHDAPVGVITCWPVRSCTDLQLTTMEAVFGRWLETTGRMPALTEEKVIDALFTFASDEPPIEKPFPSLEPNKTELDERLDRLTEFVKDAVLDWNATTFAPDDPAPGEDAPLGPLLREPFVAAMREKLTETVEQVADLVGPAPTARALATYEPRVAEMLADLRGEALALALEMRGLPLPALVPTVNPRVDAPHTSLPRWLRPDAPWPPAPEFPGGWVKKYRRIRRAGL